MNTTTKEAPLSFAELGLPTTLIQTVKKLGYEQPSPIQAQAIKPMLEGRDLLGLAQTGTGKTAAFALPILANLQLNKPQVQILVLAPTRELALQVSEAFGSYAVNLDGFRVAPVYGGQEMRNQLRALKRGPQVVVGTPGRIMDHIRRKTLKLDSLTTLVLDEADEMLTAGFLEDVEWILEQLPEQRQMALFSATMPNEIARLTKQYLSSPVTIRTKNQKTTVESVDQSYVQVPGRRKMSALARVLEIEDYDGVIVFVRTKNATAELAQKLEAHGFSCAAINGDLSQAQREFTIDSLKNKNIDILVATDVASRGIDVPRISLVVNYDIPFNTEAYVHRVGRTGRAGRKGKALTLITPRERKMLKVIERNIQRTIKPQKFPTNVDLSESRISQFQHRLLEVCLENDLSQFHSLVVGLHNNSAIDLTVLAAALAFMAQEDRPLTVPKDSILDNPQDQKKTPKRSRKDRDAFQADLDMEVYKLEVGRNSGVNVRDILGAIANELDLDSGYIGSIRVDDDCSYVELPRGMPKDVMARFKRIRMRGVRCNAALAKNQRIARKTHKEKRHRGPRKPHKRREDRRLKNRKQSQAASQHKKFRH